MSKQSATEFSFFLAVPTMMVATLYKLLKSYHTLTPDQFGYLGLGLVISFIVAIIAVKTFIQIVAKAGFKYFGYYRIALGLIILSLVYFKS